MQNHPYKNTGYVRLFKFLLLRNNRKLLRNDDVINLGHKKVAMIREFLGQRKKVKIHQKKLMVLLVSDIHNLFDFDFDKFLEWDRRQ